MSKPILIGITGGTGSGKSTVARAIHRCLPKKNITVIEQDSYYKDQSHMTFEDRIKTNYDHPLAFDTLLLIEHLNNLLEGKPINKPIYDFESHTRKTETELVEPKDIIILEGIMLLDEPTLRSMLDIKIFVDTDADVRIIRRIVRDINHRGRDLNSIINQYLTTVRPAHLQFVEPNKKYADIIIPEGGDNKVAIDIMVTKIQDIINNRKS
ncbi:uridine kinase [Serpentinicella alkaliphila]|uniref:Uridine kinase n=1 Tax=Serpentinicella alkaliphila TaxID=1734049 RepID=A0A4R2TDC8_9FIRM|nr:uridine kinase [Serpentinicella alkaliphila]QUH26676.1 uridine kinase [Serpentinicella alkaliphila]TCQ00526.1 uridine kinase [Serpentinicella alkaliphila]